MQAMMKGISKCHVTCHLMNLMAIFTRYLKVDNYQKPSPKYFDVCTTRCQCNHTLMF